MFVFVFMHIPYMSYKITPLYKFVCNVQRKKEIPLSKPSDSYFAIPYVFSASLRADYNGWELI